MTKNATGSRQTLPTTTTDVHLCACMTGAKGWCDCHCHNADLTAAERMLGADAPIQVLTMELPNGRDWVTFPDLNMVGLSPRLDAAGRERALAEIAAAKQAA